MRMLLGPTAAWLCVIVLAGCSPTPTPGDPTPGRRPPSIVLPPPSEFPLPEPPPTCPQIWVGDYFWAGNTQPDYPYWSSGVRVFWRPGVPLVAALPVGPGRSVPVRWVVHHIYGGCGPRDAGCGEAAVRALAGAGVRYIEVANEADANCGSCLAEQKRTAELAKRLGLHVTVNVEPFPPASPEDAFRLMIEWVRAGLADRIAVHALLPGDVPSLPPWLPGPWELEFSTDGQHCADRACAHVDTGELLRALVGRYGTAFTFEADLYEDGRIGRGPWSSGERSELDAFVARGCR